MSYTLHHGDCLGVMATLPDQSVDSIICDPPYGTTACTWDSVIPFEPMWRELKRIIKPRGAIVLFGSQPFTSALVMSNVKWFKHQWVWRKTHGGGFFNVRYAPLKRHEDIVVFGASAPQYYPQKTPGRPYRCTSTSIGDALADTQRAAGWQTVNTGDRYPTSVLVYANATTRQHPTQKPVALMEYLIKTYTNAGETVLDFTCGSGTTGVAALNLGRRFIGIERDDSYFAVASQRIADAQAAQ